MTQKACKSSIIFFFFSIYGDLYVGLSRELYCLGGSIWLAGLQLKRRALKLISPSGIKKADHRLTLTLVATGLKSRRLHGLLATDVEFSSLFHQLSQSCKSRLWYFWRFVWQYVNQGVSKTETCSCPVRLTL
jgi:hypothetical protein